MSHKEITSGKQAFIVVNPDESPLQDERFWGEFASLEEAQTETPKLRRQRGIDDPQGGIGDQYSQVEQWRDGALIAAWSFHPSHAPLWNQVYPR